MITIVFVNINRHSSPAKLPPVIRWRGYSQAGSTSLLQVTPALPSNNKDMRLWHIANVWASTFTCYNIIHSAIIDIEHCSLYYTLCPVYPFNLCKRYWSWQQLTALQARVRLYHVLLRVSRKLDNCNSTWLPSMTWRCVWFHSWTDTWSFRSWTFWLWMRLDSQVI
jgi:hypothetical protein